MSWSSWLCSEDLCRFLFSPSRLFCWCYPPRRIANSYFQSTSTIAKSHRAFLGRKYPSGFTRAAAQESNDLRATTKEAQHRRNQQTIHPPLFTSLPPHNIAKMLLGMKKFPVKVRK
jgi:hypothetical protein